MAAPVVKAVTDKKIPGAMVGRPALEVAMRQTGGVPNRAFQALMFAAWWGLFSEAAGHPLTTYELSKATKGLSSVRLVGEAQLYRHGRAFRECFPGESDPARMWSWVCEDRTPADYAEALGALASVAWRR